MVTRVSIPAIYTSQKDRKVHYYESVSDAGLYNQVVPQPIKDVSVKGPTIWLREIIPIRARTVAPDYMGPYGQIFDAIG